MESIRNHHHKVYALITATRDVYGDDMAAFLCFMGVRLLEMHRVLKPTGSIYLHCDPTASHYLKGLMDAVFGRQNFRNEIRWAYKSENISRKKWARGGDVILFYTKSDARVFNPMSRVTDVDELEALYPLEDDRGRYKLTSCQNNADRPNMVYEWNGHIRQWRFMRSTMELYEREGRLVYDSVGIPRRKTYMGESMAGGAMSDSWTDIAGLPASSERTGYPTQKPLALYERIVRASSNRGDIVLDPFAGCATTAVAAQSLRRNWVAIDIEGRGYDLTKQRMSDERALDQQTIVIGPAITDLPARTDDGRTAAEPLNPKPRRQRPPSKIDKDRDRKLDILIKQFGLQCWGCGFTPSGDAAQLHGRDFFELDHIKPQSERGTHDILNRAVLCGPCNRRKGGFGGTLTALREDNETAQRLYGPLLRMERVIDWHARYDPDEERLL